ncbi:MAG: DUF3795 domain-containing protein [Dehalococcoidales bacterium]|nr:DUF3795 domain-containing protein [Dehalococcoidales bacterium]
MKEELIAPCGMNCNICTAYMALKNDIRNKGVREAYCGGCRPRDKQCAILKRGCTLLSGGGIKYCYECDEFPCANLIKLDKKYKTNFKMSMIENLEYIKKNGIAKFLKKEEKKWQCHECGQVICCHNGICYDCGLSKLRAKKDKHHWVNN